MRHTQPEPQPPRGVARGPAEPVRVTELLAHVQPRPVAGTVRLGAEGGADRY